MWLHLVLYPKKPALLVIQEIQTTQLCKQFNIPYFGFCSQSAPFHQISSRCVLTQVVSPVWIQTISKNVVAHLDEGGRREPSVKHLLSIHLGLISQAMGRNQHGQLTVFVLFSTLFLTWEATIHNEKRKIGGKPTNI